MNEQTAGKILVKAIAEVDGRIVQAERYVEPGQAVACEMVKGEVRIAPAPRFKTTTLGLIGETGPEAVLPLRRTSASMLAVNALLPSTRDQDRTAG